MSYIWNAENLQHFQKGQLTIIHVSEAQSKTHFSYIKANQKRLLFMIKTSPLITGHVNSKSWTCFESRKESNLRI